MKRTVTRPNRIAAIALLATLFLLSCNKDKQEQNSKKPYSKTVISYNKYAGDSTHYDSKGRVIEQWVDMPFPTIYEYPSSTEVLVKSIERSNGKVNARFVVTLDNGRANKVKATYYDVNNAIYKEYTSQFIYDGVGRLSKITNPYGYNSEIVFTYTGEVVTSIKKSMEETLFWYDMNTKMSVPVANMIYGISWDEYFYLSGLFQNGMMGKMPMYAVNKVHRPNIWQSPVEFDNTYGSGNTLLQTKLKLWESMYMSLEMDMRYKTITVVP